MSVAGNVAKVQEALAEQFSTEVMEDWMTETSEEFIKIYDKEFENEVKTFLQEKFPEWADLLE